MRRGFLYLTIIILLFISPGCKKLIEQSKATKNSKGQPTALPNPIDDETKKESSISDADLDGDGNPDNWCREGFFASQSEFKLGKIIGNKGEQIHFYNDEKGCPNAYNPKCINKSYLIPDDEIIIAKVINNWACSWYQPKKGSATLGWLPLEKITLSNAATNPTLNRWVGTWNYADNDIEIELGDDGELKVSGNAVWKGVNDNVHIGEVNGSAKPKGNQLKIVEDAEGCQVELKLIGNFLIATDNSKCGGLNVQFDGVYRK